MHNHQIYDASLHNICIMEEVKTSQRKNAFFITKYIDFYGLKKAQDKAASGSTVKMAVYQ